MNARSTTSRRRLVRAWLLSIVLLAAGCEQIGHYLIAEPVLRRVHEVNRRGQWVPAEQREDGLPVAVRASAIVPEPSASALRPCDQGKVSIRIQTSRARLTAGGIVAGIGGSLILGGIAAFALEEYLRNHDGPYHLDTVLGAPLTAIGGVATGVGVGLVISARPIRPLRFADPLLLALAEQSSLRAPPCRR